MRRLGDLIWRDRRSSAPAREKSLRPRTRHRIALGTLVAALVLTAAASADWQPGDHTLRGLDLYGSNSAGEPGWSGAITCTPLSGGSRRIDISGTYPPYQEPFVGTASFSASITSNSTSGLLTGSFSIDGTVDATGTFSGFASFGAPDCSGPNPYIVLNAYGLDYTATIVGPTRTWTDFGKAFMYAQASCYDPGTCGAEADRQSARLAFISTTGPSDLLLLGGQVTHAVGDSDTVTVLVRGEGGIPMQDVTVHADLAESFPGGDPTTTVAGTCVTGTDGRCSITYNGPTHQSLWTTLQVFADTDLDGVQTVGEPGSGQVRQWVLPGRAVADRPDDFPGPQIHLVYVLPSDGTDRELDLDGTIADSVAVAQEWLRDQTDGRGFRIDTAGGQPDISFFQLGQTDADIAATGAYVRDTIETELRSAGFDDPDKLYLAYYGGSSTWSCGGGAWPPTLPGTVAALYLNGFEGLPYACANNPFKQPGQTPWYWEYSFIHELVHTLGFVAECAPNHTLSGHVDAPTNDLMWAGSSGSWDLTDVVLDENNDDYYDHENGSCPDLADSPYLESGSPPDPDVDGDGVANDIDAGVGSFDDGEGTFGQVVQPVAAGLSVLVEDLSPDGVRITVTGTGSERASFGVCGYPGTLKLAAGSVLELTCGSVLVQVIQGSAEVELSQQATTVAIGEGATCKLDLTAAGTPTVQNQGGGGVTVTTAGVTTTVPSGTTSNALTPAGLCALTRQTVQSSAKWQTARPVQRAAATLLLNGACKAIEQIKPTTKPAAKRALVTTYKASVDALRIAGWLTPAQATTLKTLADAV